MNDARILEEAIRLVSEGVSVTFPVNGRSMLPFIVGGRDSVVLEKPVSFRRLDIVLAEVEGGSYVVHRIVDLDGERMVLMGDGNLEQREHCKASQVKARVTHVVQPNGKRRSLECFWWRTLAKAWFILLPFRRWLLAIYRRI
jgi:hypothetical protein